jgi:curved DNA-binding protein CbpA
MSRPPDPYQTLGVSPRASDAELRAAYRRLVLRHHPDHNGGSAESARRFEAVQEAYAQIRLLRASATDKPDSTQASDPGLEARLAEMERELAQARAQRERVRAARDRERARERARQAARAADGTDTDGSRKRPTDEELGYIKTDDSFSKIFSDAVSQLSDSLTTEEHHASKRISDLIDELEAKFGGQPPGR